MNLIQILVNSGISAVFIGLAAWLMRRWVVSVDENIRQMIKKMQDLEVKIAAMPGKYTLKQDCQNMERNSSDKRSTLLDEFNKLRASFSERLARIETKVEGSNV